MSGPSHDQIAELLGAHALHAVEPDEAALVEAHVAECPRCRAELHDHRAVATLLGNSGGDAPDGLWDRIASALEEAPPPMRLDLQAGEGRVVPLAPRRAPEVASARLSTRGRWLAAAAAVVVIAGLGAVALRQEDRISDLQATLARQGTSAEAMQALSDPDARTVELASADGSVSIPAVLLPDGTGYLLAGDLAALGPQRTYQLWGQTDAGLVSLGLLGSNPNDVVAFQGGHEISALAVTDEEAPGVVQSANQPVVAGAFT